MPLLMESLTLSTSGSRAGAGKALPSRTPRASSAARKGRERCSGMRKPVGLGQVGREVVFQPFQRLSDDLSLLGGRLPAEHLHGGEEVEEPGGGHGERVDAAAVAPGAPSLEAGALVKGAQVLQDFAV